MQKQWKLLAFAVLHLISLNLFLKGFFPLKRNIPGVASHDAMQEILTKENLSFRSVGSRRSLYDRAVVIVIDALRQDFIFDSKFSKNMKFTSQVISQGPGFGFIAKANAPTVTLPRIKALLTGNIPGFSDVITNVNAKALEDDNWVGQLTSSNRTAIFYGDDTWIKLLPNQFKRFEGTTSFFVNDYTEVDLNVTRHLKKELAIEAAWDVMILHYLGLDHIGHLAGPFSPLIPNKLQEMDQVIQTIFRGLLEKDKHDNKKSVMIVCGDHGMSDSGSHGGATPSEIDTPLLILPVVKKSSSSKGLNSVPKTISQIDIAPTISALLNLPIPKNNLGKVIMDVLNYSPEDLTFWLFSNVLQVIDVFRQYSLTSFEVDSCSASYKEAVKLQKKISKGGSISEKKDVFTLCASVIDCVKHKVMSKLINYDMYSIIVAIISFLLGSLGLIKELCSEANEGRSAVPSSVLYLFGCVALFVHVIACTGCCSSSILCSSFPYMLTTSLTLAFYLHTVLSFKISHFKAAWLTLSKMNMVEGLMVLALLVQCLSLGSSSFIEEEHQIWYFFISSWCVVILYHSSATFLSGLLPDSNRTSSKYQGASWLIVLVLFRLARKWNQTGNKWAHVPDIGDYLNQSENKWLLTLLVISSIIVIAAIHVRSQSAAQNIITCLAMICIIMVKATTGNLVLPFSYKMQFIENITYARITYLLIASLLIATVLKSRKSNETDKMPSMLSGIVVCWSLLTILLFRPHNIVLFAMISLIELVVSHVCRQSIILVTVIYFWFAYTSFFLQGNSGSLATIDVSAGYIGTSEHEPFFTGMLMMCNTYSCFMYWLLCLLRMISSLSWESNSSFAKAVNQMSAMLILYKSTVILFYSIVVTSQRYHLFIWTVFSPKMLYEAASSIVITIFILLASAATLQFSKFRKSCSS